MAAADFVYLLSLVLHGSFDLGVFRKLYLAIYDAARELYHHCIQVVSNPQIAKPLDCRHTFEILWTIDMCRRTTISLVIIQVPAEKVLGD